MTLDVAIRLQVRRLLDLGMTQKAIGARMGMKPSAFNRWFNEEKKNPAGLNALQGLRHLLADLKAEATRDVMQLSDQDRGVLEAEMEAVKTLRQIRKNRAAMKPVTKDRKKGR